MSASYPGAVPHQGALADRGVNGLGAAHRRPHVLVRAALAVEGARWLDPVTRVLAPVAEKAVGTPTRRYLLQGHWLGHSAHPFFVAVPLGVWTGVAALDVFGGARTRDTCRTLTGFGVLMAVPSAVTGLAEWADTGPRDRRTATVHAAVNSVGLVLYTRSWLARRRGRHLRGVLWGQAGYALVNVGGFFGGHLTEARKVGSRHPALDRD